MDNLFVISNIKQNDKYYQLLPYKEGRNNSHVGSDILSFGVFAEEHTLIHKVWNNNNKKYEFVHFLKLSQSINNQTNKKKSYVTKV